MSRHTGGDGVMVWVGFTFDRKLKLYMWNSNVNAKSMVDALTWQIEPFFAEPGHETFTFYQDNAPVHSARLTQGWLSERNIKTIKMVAYSPDLNPAEHALSMLCRLVYHNGRQFRSISELKAAFQTAWAKTSQESLNHAINSMPDRLAEVIANGGGLTDY